MPDIEEILWEIEFFEGVVQNSPSCCDALKVLGNLYTQVGSYRKGLEIDLRLTRLLPEDSMARYNLACSYSLLERLDEAFEALDRAVELGYEDLYWLGQDDDLDNLRADDRYSLIVDRIQVKKRRRGTTDEGGEA